MKCNCGFESDAFSDITDVNEYYDLLDDSVGPGDPVWLFVENKAVTVFYRGDKVTQIFKLYLCPECMTMKGCDNE